MTRLMSALTGCPRRNSTSRRGLMAFVVFAAVACGAPSPSTDSPQSAIAPPAIDGVPDCVAGRVQVGADTYVLGDSEQAVVSVALAEWTNAGATLVETPEAESWSAVVDRAEVAVAVPEREGDGRWVVADVVTCGDPRTGPAPIDGKLDCPSDLSWSMQGSVTGGRFRPAHTGGRDRVVPHSLVRCPRRRHHTHPSRGRRVGHRRGRSRGGDSDACTGRRMAGLDDSGMRRLPEQRSCDEATISSVI